MACRIYNPHALRNSCQSTNSVKVPKGFLLVHRAGMLGLGLKAKIFGLGLEARGLGLVLAARGLGLAGLGLELET